LLLAPFLVGLSVILAACGTGALGTPAAASSNRGVATRDAEQLLGRALLPAGSQRLSSEPAGGGKTLAGPFSVPKATDLVDLPRFAIVPGSSASIVGWLEAHPPLGGRFVGSGTGGSATSDPDVWEIQFSWPPVGQVLDSRTLVFTAAQLSPSKTGVRIDAEVTWLPAKPSMDQVPSGLTVLTAVLSHGPNSLNRGYGPTTTTNPVTIAAVRTLVNALPVSSPGATSCPEDFGQTLTLAFRSKMGANPVVVVSADVSGCQGVTVTRAGAAAGPSLSGMGFTSAVEHALGWHLRADGPVVSGLSAAVVRRDGRAAL
jgi:hypothetical protein